MLFAALILPREPMPWSQLDSAIHLWLQNAGSVAGLGLGIWVLANLLQRRLPFAVLLEDWPLKIARPLSTVLAVLTTISLLGFLVIGAIGAGSLFGVRGTEQWLPRAGQEQIPGREALSRGDYILSTAGLLALVVAVTPMALGLFRMRARRIWALARLSIKEAIRRRVVGIFALIALVFLFAEWFMPVHHPEDQVRNYVRLIYWSIPPLFLMTASVLGAFSIPSDIKSQSIHTIVTKPVEKFEIVLGRFLGYGLLLTAGLFVVALLSLGYVARGVNEQARQETLTARVPVFGEISFVNTSKAGRGESVGREYEYRGYISGPQLLAANAKTQYAVWFFKDLPSDLATREEDVTVEFTFDIFRLSKGQEDRDIPCTFTFIPGTMQLAEAEAVSAKIQQERVQLPRGQSAEQMKEELINRYGVYEDSGVAVTDYHTQSVRVPAAFFRKLFAMAPASRDKAGEQSPWQLIVLVNVDRAAQSQMVGMARRDLYILAAERPFWLNFFKGIVGMWCTYMLVLGVAIACSTYLSALISWLCTMFFFGAGLFTEYLQQLANNQVPGGGPAEAAYRVFSGRVQAAQLDQSPATSVLRGTDVVFNWVLRRILNLIPDVTRFDLHTYVANGFDVPFTGVLVIDNLLPLVGYLLPWAIVAYYLMKYREIANPT